MLLLYQETPLILYHWAWLAEQRDGRLAVRSLRRTYLPIVLVFLYNVRQRVGPTSSRLWGYKSLVSLHSSVHTKLAALLRVCCAAVAVESTMKDPSMDAFVPPQRMSASYCVQAPFKFWRSVLQLVPVAVLAFRHHEQLSFATFSLSFLSRCEMARLLGRSEMHPAACATCCRALSSLKRPDLYKHISSVQTPVFCFKNMYSILRTIIFSRWKLPKSHCLTLHAYADTITSS